MRKRMAMAILASLALITLFSVKISKNDVRQDKTKENIYVPIITPELTETHEPTITPVEECELQILSLDSCDITEEKIKEAQKKIDALDKSDKKKWFKKYKKIQEEYSEWIDPDETIYDCFTKEELDLLFKIVEAEVTGTYYFQSKINVASVIFNRLDSDDFPDGLTEILTQRKQFSSYWDGRYNKVEVTEETILATEFAFRIGDSTNGALYFDSCTGGSWADRTQIYIFTDSVGHSFYKGKD